jgi:ribosomal protein L30E
MTMSCSELKEMEDAANAWRTLMELCGYWQDGSQETVKLVQDDATCTCIIVVGNEPRQKRFYVERGDFLSAIKMANEHLAAQFKDDPTK